jgi:two-component system response regulator ArlR
MRILIIEDEVRLAESLADVLSQNQAMVDIRHDGPSGLDSAQTGIYDAIILDIMLPGMDGYEVIRHLRRSGICTPVLMLTAKAELKDRVRGLDSGVDYYLTKPFATPELLACLRAIMRRGTDMRPETITYDDLQLTLATCVLSCGMRSVRLGAKELELMRLLMINKDIHLSKEQIYVKVWGYDSQTDNNIVEVYISFLRKKLALIGSRVRIAVTRRIGYRLEVHP